MKNKKELGQFYTKKAAYIIKDLLDIFPADCEIIDPFCGEWDLLDLVKDAHKVIGYDIDPKNSLTEENDSLLSPPNYSGKWVITNPPYLARNKSSNKFLFDTYNLDDLYKISLETIIGCEGGLVIVPVNFFSSQDDKMRKKFLSNYIVKKVYVYEEVVFDDTTYTICCFSFIKKENEKQEINFTIFPNNETIQIVLKEEDGYSIGKEVFSLKEEKVKIRRLLKNETYNKKAIFIMAVDTRRVKICFDVVEPFFGKTTDRCFASVIFEKDYTESELKKIAEESNNILNFYRDKYKSLFLTNYRDFGRKRLGFDLAYSIIKNAIFNLWGKNESS